MIELQLEGRFIGIFQGRDEGVLTLEEAVRKMTSLPAAWIGQNERGVLREGALADVVVFDFETIRGEAAYTDPHQYSRGVQHVFVSGEGVLENGEMTGARPGRFLKRSRERP